MNYLIWFFAIVNWGWSLYRVTLGDGQYPIFWAGCDLAVLFIVVFYVREHGKKT